MIASAGMPAFHRLAGQTIWIDPGLPELQPFRLANQAFPHSQIPAMLSNLAEALPAIQATGWLADNFTTVSLWPDEFGTLMEIPAAGRFWTAADGSAIHQVSQVPGSDPAFLAEALLGPPLVLALALRNTWCLHASAVEYGGRVIAFLGESGAGKVHPGSLSGKPAGCAADGGRYPAGSLARPQVICPAAFPAAKIIHRSAAGFKSA